MARHGAGLAATLSDSAVLAGLYVTGAVAFVGQLTAIDHRVPALTAVGACAIAFCTTVGVYLLDRVKLRDAWLDPADADSHPRRHAFIIRHAAALRILSVLLLTLASWLSHRLIPWGAVLPLLAAISVLTYAGKPRREHARPKDILLLKNAYVAVGISGFATLIVLGAGSGDATIHAMFGTLRAHAIPLAIVASLLTMRVLADAVLCDIDDEPADRRFKTRTLPVRLGRARAWNLAMCVRLLSAALLAIAPVLPLVPRVAWAVVTAASSLALRTAAPSKIRDWVDARFIGESLAVIAIVAIQRHA